MDYRQYLSPEQLDAIYAQDKQANSSAMGALEALAALGSGAIAEPAAGLWGLLGLAATQDPSAAARGVEVARDALTYQPRTEAGRTSVTNVAEALAPIGEMIQGAQTGAGDYVFDKTESPLLAALTQAVVGGAPDIAGSLLGAKALPKGRDLEIGDIGGQAGGERGAIAGFVDAKGNPVNTDELMQTRIAGDRVQHPVLERRTAAGYIGSPLVSQMDALVESGDVSKPLRKGILDQMGQYPEYAAMQNARELGGASTYVDNLYARAMDYEGLLGKPLVMLPADKTSVALVDTIGGVKLKTPIRTEGGPLHSDWQGDWASMRDAAVAKQGHANRIADETKQEPIYMYTNMDHEGSNFSTMASEGVLRYLEAVGDLTDDGKAVLDAKMKSLPDDGDTKGIAKEWSSYDSWEKTLDWLTDSKNKTGDTSLGNRRKAFMSAIANKEMQKYGAPNVDDVYSAINEIDLREQPAGFSGYRAAGSVVTDPRDLEYRPDGHGSYDTRIPLRDVYALNPDQMVPWDIMFPEMAKARAAKSPAKAYRSAQVSGGSMDYQMANEEWLNGILDFLSKQGQEK